MPPVRSHTNFRLHAAPVTLHHTFYPELPITRKPTILRKRFEDENREIRNPSTHPAKGPSLSGNPTESLSSLRSSTGSVSSTIFVVYSRLTRAKELSIPGFSSFPTDSEFEASEQDHNSTALKPATVNPPEQEMQHYSQLYILSGMGEEECDAIKV
jgi:hypothetical protein